MQVSPTPTHTQEHGAQLEARETVRSLSTDPGTRLPLTFPTQVPFFLG